MHQVTKPVIVWYVRFRFWRVVLLINNAHWSTSAVNAAVLMQSHKLLHFQQKAFEQTFALHVRCGIMAPRMKWCSGCEFARYCGRDCQKADYRAHRIDCNGQWSRNIRHSGRGHFFGMFSGYDFYLWSHLLLQSSPSPVKLWCEDYVTSEVFF